MEHVVAPQGLEASDRVTQRVVTNMTQVKRTGRIGKHLEHVVLVLALVFAYSKISLFRPDSLPLQLDSFEIVMVLHCFFPL